MATRKKKNNIGAFGHPIYGKGFAKYGEMQPNVSSETPKDLEEAAKKYAYKGKPAGLKTVIEPIAEQVMRDFIAGAKWQAEQDQETIELAEEHAYLAGAVNEREEIMKEAVEGEVTETCGISSVWIKTKQFKPGQKVRIIIVKED